MSTTTGYEAFTLFHALKLHFTSNYDFFKYNGKVKLSKENFEHNKAKYSFYKLSRKYDVLDLRNFYVANFLESDIHWIGDIANENGEDNYLKWQKRNQSLTYRFKEDIINLFDSVEKPNDILKVSNGQYPLLLTKAMSGTIAIETLVILNDLMGFFPMWTNKITDDIVWPTWKRRVEKYSPFMNYDKEKFKQILKSCLEDYEN